MTMDTYTYRADVNLTVEIEAPNLEDAREMVDDHFGLGAGGEGVNVVAVVYTVDTDDD